jgi:hypothetical protein
MCSICERKKERGVKNMKMKRPDMCVKQHCDTHTYTHTYTHLIPRMCANQGELELVIVGVHIVYLLAGGRAEDLDDLDKLVDAALTREQRLAQHELGKHTPDGPHVWRDEGCEVNDHGLAQVIRKCCLQGDLRRSFY